jgi:hypothetical protein
VKLVCTGNITFDIEDLAVDVVECKYGAISFIYLTVKLT